MARANRKPITGSHGEDSNDHDRNSNNHDRAGNSHNKSADRQKNDNSDGHKKLHNNHANNGKKIIASGKSARKPKARVLTHHSHALAAYNTKKIIRTLLTLRGKNEIITVKKIASLSGISRFTFYFRYRSICHALTRWEEQIVKECLEFIDKRCNPDEDIGENPSPDIIMLRKMKNHNRQAIIAWLIFLSQHKEEAMLVFQYLTNQNVLYIMGSELYNRLDIKWGQYKPAKNSLLSKLWISHAVVIITEWGLKTNCNYYSSPRYVSMLINLTENPFRHCYYG